MRVNTMSLDKVSNIFEDQEFHIPDHYLVES